MPKIPQRLLVSTKLPELKDFDRLTVIMNIHHEHRGEPPRTISVGYSRMLNEKEEPYQRRFNASDQWLPIDLGWVAPEKVGCVVIENLEGRHRLVHPTDDERAAISGKVLEVSYSKNSAECDLIQPGGADVKWPASATNLYLRCQNGAASCRVSVLSK